MLIQTAGGAEDFARLYTRHYSTVYAFACRRTGDHTRAEDITAQTFLQALQGLPRYEERGIPIAAWLLRIAANIITSGARRGGREVAPVDVPLQESGEAGPEDWVERWERAAWLRVHLSTLSADQHRALWLRYGEDRVMEDVAARLERSPAAAKQLLYRGVLALRERLRLEQHHAAPT